MRLLISLPDSAAAQTAALMMEQRRWQVTAEAMGERAALVADQYDLWLLHECLSGAGGRAAVERLAARRPVCFPRILYICPPQLPRPRWADATVPTGVGVWELCRLMEILAQKPLPKLAAASQMETSQEVERFLREVALSPRLKGRGYAAWLLERMILSPAAAAQPVQRLYRSCAEAFDTSESNVERCLRVAVESVFTQGSMKGIERYFGATVDPERGKPTNRAFLVQMAEQLRYSLTLSRSPNSSEMHHSPAAPTSV